MEAEKVSAEAWVAAAAGIELRVLFCIGDRLCVADAYVRTHYLSAAFFLWIWLHGNHEPATNCRSEAFDLGLAAHVGKSEELIHNRNLRGPSSVSDSELAIKLLVADTRITNRTEDFLMK